LAEPSAPDHRPVQLRTRGGQGIGGIAAFSPPKRPIHQHATESHQRLLPTLVISPASTKQPNSSAAAWLPHQPYTRSGTCHVVDPAGHGNDVRTRSIMSSVRNE
jgi:hypothetical protein